jgi:hypothetical protein
MFGREMALEYITRSLERPESRHVVSPRSPIEPNNDADSRRIHISQTSTRRRRSNNDFYVEPEWCSERLFDVEPFVGEIIDPACGLGRIVTAAATHGHCSSGLDIAQRAPGFLQANFFEEPGRCLNIVTNPPFDIAREFAFHALELASRKVAIIFPTARLNAARWLEQTPLARIWLLTPRPSMPPGEAILRVRSLEAAKSISVGWFSRWATAAHRWCAGCGATEQRHLRNCSTNSRGKNEHNGNA